MTLGARVRAFLVPVLVEGGLVAQAPPVPLRAIFHRFWPYAKPYRRWLGASFIFIALDPILEIATIWIFKEVVDQVLVPQDFGPLPVLILAYLALTVLAGIVGFFDRYLSELVGQRFLLDLRTSFFRHIQALSLDFFERRKLGDILSRLTGDIASIESFVLSGLVDAMSFITRIAFFAVALFLLQWELALVSLIIIVPFSYGLARHFTVRIKAASRERRRRSGSISAAGEESLAHVQLVQAYNRQTTEVERFHRENQGVFAATMAATRLSAAYSPLVNMIEVTGALAVITLGTWELTQGRLSLGGLLAFLALMNQMYSPIRGLTRLVNSFYSASASAERIIEFMDETPSITELEHPRVLDHAYGVVEFEDVTFTYPETTQPAVAGLDLRVAPGETLALVGRSGAGKSTVAKLLLRFYDPTSGRITLDGADLRGLSLNSLRGNFAVLLQETLVFDGTIRDNILYGRLDASQAQIEEAARAAYAHEFIEALPEGYDTLVGQKGRRLSGGQRQRVAIARAIIRDAPVLILDEPTTGLDGDSGQRTLEAMRRLMSGRATIVISHNFLTVRDATEIVVLEGGRAVERGTHAALLERDGTYAHLHRLQGLEHRPPEQPGTLEELVQR
jgi:ATP-binding cassette subfamily B protein